MPDGCTRSVPCKWVNYELDLDGFPMTDTSKDSQIGVYIYSMSGDGRVLAGWKDWYAGDRSPAVWVDGKLTRIYGETPEIDNEAYIYSGVAWGINPAGTKVTGYWVPKGTEEVYAFIYDIATGEKTRLDGSYSGTAIDNNGVVYMAGLMSMGGAIYINGEAKPLATVWEDLEKQPSPSDGEEHVLQTPYSVSDDGKVIGGSYSYSLMGQLLQFPCIVVIE